MPETPLHGSFNDERGSPSEWGLILAFIVLVNAVGWLACLLLRPTHLDFGVHLLHRCDL